MAEAADFKRVDLSVPVGRASDSQGLAVTGTNFSPANATIWFQKVGRWVFFTLEVNGNAGATGFASITMPYTAAHPCAFAGREDNVTGLALVGQMGANSATMTVVRAGDNGSPGGTPGSTSGNTGVHLVVSGCFEATG